MHPDHNHQDDGPEYVDEPAWLLAAVLLGIILAGFTLLWMLAP